MRIVHVIGEMGYGGAELLVGEMSVRLVAAGHIVEVLVLGYCEEEVVSALTDRGVRVVRLDARLSSPANAWRIARYLKSAHPDVVHAHLFPALYLVALARMFAGAKSRWLYTEHSTTNGRRGRRMLRPVEKWAYSKYDQVVCVSSDVKSALADWLERNHSVLVENGIDNSRFRDATPIARNDIGLKTDERVLLMVGAFRSEKNQSALVRALALLPKQYVAVFAGDGPLRAAVEALALALAVNERVRFLGVFRNVEGLMKCADIYVLPSLFEGFGLSCLEACAAGLPVVHSDVAGLSTMLDGAGWPINPLEPESIYRAILAVEDSPLNAQRKREKGALVAERYDIGNTVARHLALYTAGEEC